jgi:Tfp pilus assembly protein PilO
MILSKRERVVVVATLIAVAAFLLDRYALTPVLDALAALEARKQNMIGDVARAGDLLERQHQLGPKWREMTAAGLKRDPTEAESQMLHAVQNWSQEAGLRLTSLKPERLPDKRSLQEISFQAAGTGTMNAVSRFLWRIETAKVPIRVKELQVGSRKEGADDLTLQLRFSTLYQAPQRPLPGGAGNPAEAAGGNK